MTAGARSANGRAMTERKRVLFLINSLAGGGAERVVCTLLAHSRAERDEFDISLALLDDEPRAYAPPDGVRVIQLDCRRSFVQSVLAVRKLCEELKPVATISFLTRANLANVISSGGPCILSERSNTSAHLGGGMRGAMSRALVRRFYPNATRIVAVSQGVAEDLAENFAVSKDRLVAVANPVDVEAINSKADQPPDLVVDGPYILAVGRLQRSKNFAMLIRAYAAWGGSEKLVIMGEGVRRDFLSKIIAEHGLNGRVLLPGFVANPFAVMRGAALFVLSSNAEGFPNALVEAMALGCPVIATNCPSGPSEILAGKPRDAVTDLTFAEYGVLVPPGSEACMTEALKAMSDPDRRRDYGEKAKRRALTFRPELAKDQYWNVIRAAMAEGRERVSPRTR